MTSVIASYTTQFGLPSVGSVTVTALSSETVPSDALIDGIHALSSGVDVTVDIAALVYSASVRAGLARMTTPIALAARDGAGWRVDLPTAGVWFTCDYLMTYASAVLNTYDATPGAITEFTGVGVTIPPFWTGFVKTLEDGAGASAASGSWEP
jgi:hypothetical protein